MRGQILSLTIRGKIQPKERPRTGLNKKTGRPVIFPAKKTKSCEEWLELEFKSAMNRQGLLRIPKKYPVRLRIWFVRDDPEMPAGLMLYETKKPDLDNLEKTVMDAMNKIVFEDDSQVAVKDSRKVVQNSSLGDCVVLEVSVLNDNRVIQAFEL